MPQIQFDELRTIRALHDLPDEHLQWIIDRTEYREYEDGGQIAKFGEPAEVMWCLLEGKVDFYMNVNGRQVYFFTFQNDNITGGIGGLMPYSRMKTYPGYSFASGHVKMLRMHKDHFQELERLNPDFIQRLIGYMTERARVFATTQLQHEKVNALGNLAAGIAHELNNPAAAINSIAGDLACRLNLNYELTEKLFESGVSHLQIQNIRTLILEKENITSQKSRLTMMQRMEMEDEISDWLLDNNINISRSAAEIFTDVGFTNEELEIIKKDVGDEAVASVLLWLENLVSSNKLIQDLGEASGRISKLVGAIKSHVHMDQTTDMQVTDIQKDIENTLTLLGHKLREKNITIQKIFAENIVETPAYIGELNQVWTNLIDNAIYAMEKNGELTIKTSGDKNNVNIIIADNGKGIPKDVLPRIFEPFFTTKKVGEGTGIGLDIVNRIIKHHNGTIKANSEPGKTEFIICIPAHQHKN